MSSQLEQSPAGRAESPGRFTHPPSPPAGAFPAIAEQCEQAHRAVLGRLEEARAAGDEDQARRLEAEAEVLRSKRRRALDPDCRVPTAYLARFESYPEHPPLPEACMAGTKKGERFVWDHVIEGTGETIGERLKRRAARMRQVQIDLIAAIKADNHAEIHRLLDEEAQLWLRRDEPRILHGFSGRNAVGDEIGAVQQRLRSAREAGRPEEIRSLEEEVRLLWQKLDKVCRTPGDVVDALYQLVDPDSVKPVSDFSDELPFDPVTGRSRPNTP